MIDPNTFYGKIRSDIDRDGQSMIAVRGGADTLDELPFVYTIGNAEKGLPELLLVGDFSPQSAGAILNAVGALMREAGAVPEEVFLGGTFPVRLRKAGPVAKREFTIQASRFLEREDYDVMQVLLCDPEGNFPDQASCYLHYRVPMI